MRPLLLVTLLIPSCLAQQPLTLREAVNRAVASHALIPALGARIDIAEGLRNQAGLRPDPKLFFQTENLRHGGATSPFHFGQDTDNFLYLTRTFELARKRGHRVALASAEVRTAELARDVARFQIASRVSAAYWNAAGAAHVRDLLRRTVTTFDRIVQYHRDRVREGAAAEADLIRVQLEQDRFQLAAESAAQDAERARIALYREMGVEPEPATDFAEALHDFRPPAIIDEGEALAARPEVQAVRQLIDRARANAGLQRSLAVPDPELIGGYKRSTGFNTAMAGLQITLPFQNRNQGAIAAAEAEIRSAEFQARAVENSVRAEIQSAVRDYEAKRRQLETTVEPLRQRAEETQRIAQAAYREGGTDLLRLLDAERTRLEAELLYIRMLIDYQQSVVTLRTALGVMP